MLGVASAQVSRNTLPGMTPGIQSYLDALYKVTYKSPETVKILISLLKRCIPYPRPTMILQKSGFTALFTTTRQWRENLKMNVFGVYNPTLNCVILDEDTESWAYRGLVLLHELVHCRDSALGLIDTDSFSKSVEAEYKAVVVTFQATNDICNGRLLEYIKDVFGNKSIRLNLENRTYDPTHAQCALMDLKLGFPRAKTSSDLVIRHSFHTMLLNFALFPSEAERKIYIQKAWSFERKNFKKP